MKQSKPAVSQKTAESSIAFTVDDLLKLQKIGLAIDMVGQLGRDLEGGNEETAINAGIDLTKGIFWRFYYELDNHFIEAKDQKGGA